MEGIGRESSELVGFDRLIRGEKKKTSIETKGFTREVACINSEATKLNLLIV